MRKNALRRANVWVEDVPAPQCGEKYILLANQYSLISAGTEMTAVSGSKRDMILKALRSSDIRQTVVDMLVDTGVTSTVERVKDELTKWTALGYSGAGVAIEVGRDVEGISPGDLVAYGGEPHAEYIRAAKNLCVRVPAGVTAREAAFVALGSIALQAVRRSEVQVGDVVVVLGLGLVGQLVAQVLCSSGVRVIGCDTRAARAELARSFGVEHDVRPGTELAEEVMRYTHGVGADRVVICASAGGHELLEQAVAMCRDRGRIVAVGMVDLDVPREPFYRKELDLVISRSYGPGRYDQKYEEQGIDYPIGYVRWTENRNMQEFLRLIQARKVDVSRLTTHEFPVENADQAYECLASKSSECLAVVLSYPEISEPPQRKVAVHSRPVVPAADYANVAVIGCGSFAKQFHLPNLRKSPLLRLHTVVASSGQTAKEMAVRYGAKQCATELRSVWDDSAVQAVMIITRDSSHAPLVVEAIRAGKHVFCEKPLATSYDDCRLLISALEATDRVCMVGFNRRFAPLLQPVKKILDECSGPKMVHYRVNAGPIPKDSWIYDPSQSAGRIVGEACHFVDLFCWLLGAEPVSVTAAAPGHGQPATRIEDISAVFRFADGSTASLIYTSQGSSRFGKERLEVFCDGTAIAMDDFRRLTVRGKHRLNTRQWRQDKGHSRELEHFAAVICGKAQPRLNHTDGIRAAVCCLKLIESARTGNSVLVCGEESSAESSAREEVASV